MTDQELTASLNIIQQFELLQWAVGIFGSIVVAMSTGFVMMYRDSRSERREYFERLEQLVEKNNEVINKNAIQTERLCEIVDRTERTTQNLEKLILQKLT
jgi:C4-dicarboxylate transporter